MRTGSARSFPVQVRLAYLTLLLAGAWEPLAILHWIQLVGTTAMGDAILKALDAAAR